MRYQSLKAGCGPTALANALELYGIKRTEDEVAKLCGTTSAGTDHTGIVSALQNVGKYHGVIETKNASGARDALHYAICYGRPVICCVDNWDHWVVAAGQLGERLLVLDSASTELCLVYPLTGVGGFTDRWLKNAKRGGGYYGIIVG